MKTEPKEALKNLIREVYDVYESDGRIENIVNYESAEKAMRIAFEEGQSNPKIKQLEWLDDNFPYRGCSVFVDYIIPNKIGSRYTVILDIGNGIRINSFKTIDEAKAAAQADFEKRVTECLDLKVQHVIKSVCEHDFRQIFINRPRICKKCGEYETE